MPPPKEVVSFSQKIELEMKQHELEIHRIDSEKERLNLENEKLRAEIERLKQPDVEELKGLAEARKLEAEKGRDKHLPCGC